MELRYSPRFASKEERKSRIPMLAALSLVLIGGLITTLATDGRVAAIATVFATAAVMWGFAARLRRLAVVADDSGVTAINWLSSATWGWHEISAFEYAPRPIRFAGDYYTGLVRLTDGQEHCMAALRGSVDGEQRAEQPKRRFIAELSAELARRRVLAANR